MKKCLSKKWKVYILETNLGTLYTGITNDLKKRIATHKKGKGALFTRLCGVKKLLYSVNRPNRSLASIREAEIKKWPRKKKLELIKDARVKKRKARVSGNWGQSRTLTPKLGGKNAVSKDRRPAHQRRRKKSAR